MAKQVSAIQHTRKTQAFHLFTLAMGDVLSGGAEFGSR
jgi:hypothetical protein